LRGRRRGGEGRNNVVVANFPKYAFHRKGRGKKEEAAP